MFYGRVDRAEYKTRKGNKPIRLLAESDTRPPVPHTAAVQLNLTGLIT